MSPAYLALICPSLFLRAINQKDFDKKDMIFKIGLRLEIFEHGVYVVLKLEKSKDSVSPCQLKLRDKGPRGSLKIQSNMFVFSCEMCSL